MLFLFSFELQISLKDIGEIYKIRIGHDNGGKDPSWYLEEIRLESMDSHELFCLSVDAWIAENDHDGDTWREMPIMRAKRRPLPGKEFQFLCDVKSKFKIR